MSESAGFVTIKDLAGATLATEDDDLIIQQGEETKRINLKTLGDLLVFLDKIEQVKTSTENGGINKIKATLSDGSTATFTTQNGHGIQKIEQTVKSDVSSGTNVITATLSDGQTCDFEIKNGDQGEKGDTGAALIDVVQKETSAASGGKNVISFKLNDGSYKDVEVYNGAKGEKGDVSQEVLNQTVNEAIAGVVANAPEDFNTLKEMSDWISEHEDDATAMNTAILENKNSIERLETGKTIQTKYETQEEDIIIAIKYKDTKSSFKQNDNQSILFQCKRLNFAPNTHIIGLSANPYDNKKRYSFVQIGGFSKSSYNESFYIDETNFIAYIKLPSHSYSTFTNLSDFREPITFTLVDEIPSTAKKVDVVAIQTQINNITNYSTTPQKIGTWIDGKSIYRVVIENELEGNVVGHLAGRVESGAKIISVHGQITDVMQGTYTLPCFNRDSQIGLKIEDSSIYFTGYSSTSFSNVKLVVEYTK